jgi:hypothetical protein
MKRLFCLLVFLGLLAAAQAQTVTDDFSGSLSNWGSVQTVMNMAPPPPPSLNSFALTQNGRMDWTSTLVLGTSGAAVILPYTTGYGPYGSAWSITLDVTNAFTSVIAGQEAQIGFFVSPTNSPNGLNGPENYIKWVLKNDAASASAYIHGGLHASMQTPNTYTGADLGQTSARLRLSYATTGVFTTEYSLNGGTNWLSGASWGIDADTQGTTGNLNWNASSAVFAVGIYAASVNQSTTLTLVHTTGELFADNFSATDVNAAAPVPEPSTYAAFVGLGALGFVALRRRKKAA